MNLLCLFKGHRWRNYLGAAWKCDRCGKTKRR